MNCGQSRKLFSAYWDDELTQAEREWLESHFASCTGCHDEYEQFARTLELAGSLPRIEPQPELAERALARARRLTPLPDRLPIGTPRWIPITATIALVAISGAIVLSSLTPGRSRVNPSSVATAVPEPQLVQPLQTATSSTTTGPIAASTSFNAAVSDSLFDHSEDVEFILDPVTVRKGRAHPASRLSPESVRGAQAVITF